MFAFLPASLALVPSELFRGFVHSCLLLLRYIFLYVELT